MNEAGENFDIIAEMRKAREEEPSRAGLKADSRGAIPSVCGAEIRAFQSTLL